MRKDSFLNKIDFVFLISAMLIICSGLLALYSSTYMSEGLETNSLFFRQAVWITIGLIAMFIITFTPLKVFYALSYHFYLLSIVLLIFVLLNPGTSRWIYIAGIQFQPSEFAKIATILALSRFLTESKIAQNNKKDIIISFIIVSVPIILIREQPDLGTSLVLGAFLLPLLFWAGLPTFSLFVMVAPFISLIAISLSVSKIYIFVIWMVILTIILYFARKGIFVTISNYIVNLSMGIVAPFLWNKLKPYQQKRILNFLNPEMDPRGTSYQLLQ